MWQQQHDNTTYNWYQASGTADVTYNPSSTDVCGELNLGGYTDWRLPHMKELQLIIDYGTFPGLNNTNRYWSSDVVFTNPAYAWTVDLDYVGVVYNNSLNAEFMGEFVKCVRGDRRPSGDYTDNGDGTVTDVNTSLVWQQQDDDTVRTWEEALSYCENLVLAGIQDWRLPNTKELLSIYDTTNSPAINSTFFPGTNYELDDSSYMGVPYYWSATTNAESSSFASGVTFYGGLYLLYPFIDKTESILERCVSGGSDAPVASVDTVISAGQIWMDRNLGASRVATSMTDSESYGDLYQWGRGSDGHQLRDSQTTTILSSTDDPGHDDFIIPDETGDWDWRFPHNPGLWQGLSGGNNPCPAGFRLPTKSELDIERSSWGSDDAAGAFASPLKLVMAGFRSALDGNLHQVGTTGRLWSSTEEGGRGIYLRADNEENVMGEKVSIGPYMNGMAFSVRCLKD
jgi:uncharacterized protein (TIGR02145 family)